MPNKIKMILNPTTNHGRSVLAASDLRPITSEYGADWSGTVYPGHAAELSRQAGEQGYSLVVAAGGDGTVHEVINGLMQLPEEKRPALGIVPLGSGNDFAHILGLPDNPAQALLSCINGKPHSLDIGKVRAENGSLEYFNNTTGIGFDAVVTIHTRKITNIHGFLMYFAATMQTILLNFSPMSLHVQTDQESWDEITLMLTLGNGPREGGGFIVTPEARLDDGLLNYVAVRKISRLSMLQLVPKFMKGTHGQNKQVRMGACRRMSVASQQPLYIHCDGEIFAGFGTDIRKLEIELLPNAIQFMKQ